MDETAILRKSEQQPFSGCHNAAPTAEGKEPGHPWAHSLLPSPRALGRVSTSLCPRACARFQTRTQSCHPALLQKESAQVMADGLLLSTYSHCSTGVLGSPSLLTAPLAAGTKTSCTSTLVTISTITPSLYKSKAADEGTAHPHST